MIYFQKIKYKNILSVGNNFIEIDLSSNNKTLIVGKNGHGKSILIESLMLGLFNKPYRKDTTKPGMVNSINKKNLLIEIEFSKGSKNYKVIRGIKPNKFEIYENGKMLDVDSNAKDAQENLENNILEMNYKSFSRIVILGTTNYVPFMELTTPLRRELIEDLLDLSIFSRMNENLKSYIKENNSKISDLKNKIEIINEKINSQNRIIQNIEDKSSKDLNIMKSEISECEIEITNKQEDLKKLRTSKDQYDSVYKEKTKYLNKLNEVQKLIHDIDFKINSLIKEKSFLENNTKCNSCKQDIDEKFRNKKLDKIEKDLEQYDKSKAQLNSKGSSIQKKLDAFEQVEKKLSSLNSNISSVTTTIQHNKNRIVQLQNQIKELEKDQNLDKEKEQLLELQDKQNLMNSEYNKFLETKEDYLFTQELLKDDGIKSSIIKNYIPKINQAINMYLHKLNFFVEFTLNENFEEKILSRFRDSFRYGNFSEGEKMRINLGILFAWREIAKLKNSLNTNLLVLDEIFDSSLDNDGISDFVEILDSLTDGTNTFVISHKVDELHDKFDHVLHFRKTGNFTQILQK